MNNLQNSDEFQKKVSEIEYKQDKNDFSNLKIFDKSIQAKTIKLENYASNPTVGSVGELAVVAGVLKICTVGGATPTWSAV